MYRVAPASHRNAFGFAPAGLTISGPAIRTLSLLLADALAVTATVTIVAAIFAGSDWQRWANAAAVMPAVSISMMFAIVSGCHRHRTSFRETVQHVVRACLYVMGIEVLLGITFGELADRTPIFAALGILPVVVAALNAVTRHILGRAGLWRMPVVLAGGSGAKRTHDGALDYRIAGRVGLDALKEGDHISSIRALLAAHDAEGLLIVPPGRGRNTLVQDIADRAALEGVPVEITLPLERAAHNEFRCCIGPGGLVLSFEPSLATAAERAAKSIIDIVAALLLLILLAPVMLLIAAAIRRDGGPALFVHRRIGLGGRTFGCLKFRTMVTDAQPCLEALLARDPEAAREWRETHKLRNDPRVTHLGWLLRRSSLDELPQLINVLRRDMSLVGPRPIEDCETHHYGGRIGYYYAVRPGITGLWQVSGRSNTSYERRVNLDVNYVNGWSLAADIGILLRTIPEVLRRQGAC